MKGSILVIMTAMKTIVDGAGIGYWDVNDGIRETVQSKRPWLPDERGHVEQGMLALMVGTCDKRGVARPKLPAEYVAAAIALAVHETNWLVACHWLGEGLATNAAMVAGEDEAAEVVTAGQLCAMVLAAVAKDEQYISQFNARWDPLEQPADQEAQV